MTTPNPSRGEVALPFGGGSLILRISYGALGKMMPILFDAPPEVAANRHKWLERSQVRLNREVPEVEWMEWHHHLIGACAAAEMHTVARCLTIMAEEHHPEITFEQVMAESPALGMAWRACEDAKMLFNWRPGDLEGLERMKRVADGEVRPFGLWRWLRTLLAWPWRTASPQPSSGA